MPDWEEFPPVDKGKFFERYDKIKNTTKIRESIPDWLDDLGRKEIGRTWDGEIQALNEQAKVVLRVNTLKIQRHDLQKQLEEEQIETNAPKEFPDALILDERQNIFTTTI